MIRSTKISLKFANSGRKKNLSRFLEEYRVVVGQFIDLFWSIDKVPILAPRDTTSSINTWLSARALQCAAKQASGIVRGVRSKNDKRTFILKKLEEEGNIIDAKKLRKILEKSPISKPQIHSIQPQLDSRFVKVDWKNDTSFDGWITLSSLGDGLKILIPIKKTRHFNKLLGAPGANLLSGIHLSSSSATFVVKSEPLNSENNGVLGVDVGLKSCLSSSSGDQTVADNHDWTLEKIVAKLARKRKGSKRFKKAQDHRKNFINWSVNRLNLDDVGVVRRERLHKMRQNKKVSRSLSHWTYADIIEKLDRKCEERGVRVICVDPAYTSQKCSRCGKIKESNRKRERYACSCGNHMNADINAAINLASEEPIVPKTQILHEFV